MVTTWLKRCILQRGCSVSNAACYNRCYRPSQQRTKPGCPPQHHLQMPYACTEDVVSRLEARRLSVAKRTLANKKPSKGPKTTSSREPAMNRLVHSMRVLDSWCCGECHHVTCLIREARTSASYRVNLLLFEERPLYPPLFACC